ncbi:MAG: response regulator transcription factor [Brumimicrobium sp.]
MVEEIKVVLADDEMLFRKGLHLILKQALEINVVFEAEDGQKLMDYLKNHKSDLPDIILMDIRMPYIGGVQATKLITDEFPDISIIAVTSYDSEQFITSMLHYGAVGYLVKNAAPTEMIKTVREVYRYGYCYNKDIMRLIRDGFIHKKVNKISGRFDEGSLSAREVEVLELICQQKSNKEISEELCISIRTVEGHRKNILTKTNSKNVAGLVLYAIKNQLVFIE